MHVYRTAAACVILLAFLSLLSGVANGAALTNMEWNIEGIAAREPRPFAFLDQRFEPRWGGGNGHCI